MVNITNILLWALQGTSGAIAGYITNKYAVNMLFKEYTPFRIGEKVILPYKFGGVIKHRKEKFVEELSDLVEKDIINGRTMKSQFNSNEFKEVINKLSYKFIDESLKESFSNISFSSMPGFNTTEAEVLKFTQNNMKSCISELTKVISENINVTDFINDDEINSVSEKIYEMILEQVDEIDKDKRIDDLKNVFYDSTQDFTINELLTENCKNAIKNNIYSIADEVVFNFIDADEKIIQSIDNILEVSEAHDVIEKFQYELKEKKFSDFISDKEQKEISQYIYEKINVYLNKDGKEVICDFINNFVKIAEETDYTIYDFLGPEFSGKIIDFINQKLPVIMPYISEWIINNRDELDSVIEDSIDEAIGNMDANIKKLIISKVREFFLDNISAKNKVVNKIVSYIENYKMDEAASEELIKKIEKYLKQTKIKDIVVLLKDRNIINEGFADKLSELIIIEYGKHGQSFIEELILSLSSKRIGEVLEYDINGLFNSKIKELLTNYILDNRDKLKNNISEYIKKYVDNKIQNILAQSVGKTAPSFNIYKNLRETVIKNKNIITEKIKEEISNYITNFSLSDKFKENKELILNEITNIFVDYEKDTINQYKNKPINEIVEKISGKENISKFIGNELANYINGNSEEFLNGKVRKVVYSNLIKYDEDEICDLAQKFMGNELKPLSIFGGVLGLVAGLVFGAFFKNVNIVGFYRNIPQGIMSIVLMAVIGVFTNVIAITMLFKPYNKNKILSKIPFLNKFALGYIPAHKENLGKSIGKVIDNDILNGTKVQNLLIDNKQNTLQYAIDYFENSNYKAVINLINNKKNKIIEVIYQSLIKKIAEDNTVSNTSNKICNIKVNAFISQNNLLNLINKVKTNKNKIADTFAKSLYNKINSTKTIEEAISEHILDNINSNVIDNIDNMIYEEILNNINRQSIDIRIPGLESKYSEFINRNIKDILNSDMKQSLENYILNNAENFIFNDVKSAAISVLKKKINTEFNSDESIGTLFDGKFKILINENLNKVTDIIIEKLIKVLDKNQSLICDKVKEEVNNNLNFFEKIAYSMAGGDAIVESCVAIAVSKKIPIFINMKFYEINNLIQKSLDNVVYPMNIEELKLKADELDVNGLLNNMFERGRNSNIFLDGTNKMCKTVISYIYNENFSHLLELINLNSLEGLQEKFNDDINFVLDNVVSNLSENKHELQQYIDNTIRNDVISKIMIMPVDRILSGIHENDLYYAINTLFDTILADESMNKEIEKAFNDFYEERLANTKLKDICDESMINVSVEKSFINLLGNNKALDEIKSSITKAINTVLDSNFEFVNDEFGREISNKFIGGAIDCVIDNSKELVESVDLKKVTYEQIKIMDSKEIHDLFNSFAGEFFKKLYAYGAFGAIFGINLYLPIIWAVKEAITSNMNNINNQYKVKDNVE